MTTTLFPPLALIRLLIAAAFMFGGSPLWAITTVWVGSTGNWFTSTNWTNGVPTSSDDAVINNGGTATIASSGAAARSLTLGAAVGDAGSVIVDGGSLSVPNDCGTYDSPDDIRLGIYVGYGGTGNLSIINGGTVASGYGYIALSSSGRVMSNGSVTIDGTGSSWTLNGGALCLARLFVGGDNTTGNPGGTALLTVGGGGTVNIYNPHNAVSMPIGPSGTVSGDGTITVNGDANFSSRLVSVKGTLSPSGALPIVGNLAFNPSGTSVHKVTPEGGDNVQVKTLSFAGGRLKLRGHLSVDITGSFAASPGVVRYTLFEAQGGIDSDSQTFDTISIKYPTDQGFTPQISYDSAHVYLDLTFTE